MGCVSMRPVNVPLIHQTNINPQKHIVSKSSDDNISFADSLRKHQSDQSEYSYLSEITHFDENTLRLLHVRFNEIDSCIEKDGKISLEEFAKLIDMSTNSILVKRFFCYMDRHNMGLTFRTFATTMSVLSVNATRDEKLHLSFSLYDLDDDGYIHANELKQIVEDCMLDLRPFVFTGKQIDEIVANTINLCQTFTSLQDKKNIAKESKGISFECYCKFLELNLRTLAPFSIDIHKLVRYEAESRRLIRFSNNFERHLHHGPNAENNSTFAQTLKSRLNSMNLGETVERVNSIHNVYDICKEESYDREIFETIDEENVVSKWK